MSFFASNATLPKDQGHPTTAPGFGQAPDPFAGLSRNQASDEDDDAIDFDDTYDGLGDQLEEADDDFNDDTFGGGGQGSAAAAQPVGKDFDFFGQTAKVSDAINEEQLRFGRLQASPKSVATKAANPPKPGSQPARTGYEKYKEPGYIPDLQVNPSLWGTAAPRPSGGSDTAHGRQGRHISHGQPSSGAQPAKKMMSLEEVEASMRSQAKKPTTSQAPQQQGQMPSPAVLAQMPLRPQQSMPQQAIPIPQPVQSHHPDQRPTRQAPTSMQSRQAEIPGPAVQPPQNLQRQQPPLQPMPGTREPTQPRQILQNPRRHQAQPGPRPVEQSRPLEAPHAAPLPVPASLLHQPPIITHPEQLMQLSGQERAAFLVEDAKRAKRNHKIYLLSKDNGLMTPQDKNFVTRIQLQQLMTATGNVNDQDPDAALSEDFYYQVHSQIRGGPRQNPHQPLSHFAQTYLFQTGGRQGGLARRQGRGGDNHMQRMEQQVQRAVEAAKLKPKNKQLVIEGSLGKISFSNAKTPKPLLNIKRTESGDVTNRPQSAGRQASTKKLPQSQMSSSDRKSVLKNIEAVYGTLMRLEDHERRLPPPPTEDTDAATIQQHMEWRRTMHSLKQKLWAEMKVMEPIISGSSVLHPFIAFLSYAKGKKAIPRIFRQIDQEQRLTVLTMIVVHLDLLDVIRLAQLQPNEIHLPTAVREEVELFSQAVMPGLFGYVNEAPLGIVIGLLGLILDRVNVQGISRTKIGLAILTMLISRAELMRQAGGTQDQEWEQWTSLYNRLFDVLEPILANVFPGSINSGEDVYVWQFLAAIGIGASPEQQQRLVITVKDRVMETVMQAKTLPPEMATQRLSNVNLFMRAIGLDVELLG
ncbi:Topoisomerase II-associated protein PAT1 [Lasallia pustulata]|uniref:Topoisomerase II-associated protein PAT1 n=1 Tax=Lasallia pustulata TaxID=136370 RepID=A0A1W5DBD6_9LECA|nr:Topoisomerase II-associated protein PAT1 [Lasallia pustulata]